MGFMRSFIAFTMLVIAVVLGFGGMGAQWMDRLARTPAPMQQIVGPLVENEQVVAALKDTLSTEIRRAVPEALRSDPVIGGQVDGVVALTVDATLSDPSIRRVWNESINRSRLAYVTALDRLRGDESMESPTIWFDLSPLAELGKARLLEVAPAPLAPSLQSVQVSEVRIPLGQPSASISSSVADGVGTARHWPWMYLGAAVLAVGALFMGTRTGRWIALALAGVFATVGLWFGRTVAETVSFPTGESLAAAIRTSIVNGGTESFLAFTQPALYVTYGMVAVGVVGAVAASALRKR